jgi:hypothetical protein
MSHRIAFMGVLAAFLLSGPAVFGQDLPSAKEVMEKYIKVTGGREAHLKIRTAVTEGTLEIAGQAIKGKMHMWQEGHKSLVEVEIPGFGKIVEATDGKHAWTVNLITGNRLKEGKELDEALFDAEMHGDVNWEKRYKKVEVIGIENVDGKPAYKVIATPEKTQPRTMYFDKESGLLVKAETKSITQMGEIDAEMHVSDYREVSGVKQPFKSVLKVGPQEIIITLEKVEANVEIPKDRFEMPKEIKDLIK